MKELTQKINEVRMANKGNLLNREQLKEALKEIHSPHFDAFMVALVNNQCLTKVMKGIYKFSESPIHIDTMAIVWKQTHKKVDQYKANKKAKEAAKPASEEAINKAINLLISNGYEIYKVETIIKKTQIMGQRSQSSRLKRFYTPRCETRCLS